MSKSAVSFDIWNAVYGYLLLKGAQYHVTIKVNSHVNVQYLETKDISAPYVSIPAKDCEVMRTITHTSRPVIHGDTDSHRPTSKD